MLKLLTAPETNERGPRYMERALAAIHQAHRPHVAVTFIYGAISGRVGLFLEFAEALEELVTGPIAANYPDCTLSTVERLDVPPPDWKQWSVALELTPELFPILRHAQFEDLLNGTFADPVSAILRSVRPDEGLLPRIELHIVPAAARRRKTAQRALRLLDREFFRRHAGDATSFAANVTRRRRRLGTWFLGLRARSSAQPSRSALDTSASRLHEREENLQAAAGKIGGHLFDATIRLIVHAAAGDADRALDRLQQMAGAFGAFTQSQLARFEPGRVEPGTATARVGEGNLLSHEELATLFHPPTASVGAERLQTTEFRELEPPPRFLSGTEPEAVTLGHPLFRGDRRTIGMNTDARRRHAYVVGSTGTGKSTLLLNLIHQDMLAGRGLTVLDVHGDLAAAAIERVPKHRTNDVIVFDAAADHVVPFNPLACPDARRIDQVTSGVFSAFHKLNDSWGPRLGNLLRNAVFATVEREGTLLDMMLLLTDKAYRDTTVAQLDDDVVRSFWQYEFAGWNVQYRTEAVSSVTNKLMPFLTSRQLRAITTGPAKQSLDLRRVMDEQQILIVNLSRGRLGQDNATLLGSLLLTAIEQAAMTRADLPEAERLDHFLYLDEFQSLVTPSTEIMLSESRKYRLCLTLSHQFTRQLDESTYHAVIGNCGTLISFRLGLEDAQLLAPAMSKHAGQLAASDLCNLPNYTAYARLLIDGHPSRPFSLRTSPPSPPSDPDRPDIVRKTSDHRYAKPVTEQGRAVPMPALAKGGSSVSFALHATVQ